MPGVAILLSTYQGEAYLPAQLASLAAQTCADWHLFWRDDGSSDGSAAWMARQARATRIGDNLHRGAAQSYWRLLGALDEGPQAVAFCDQDDVWKPEKLAWAVQALEQVPAGMPALYCARQQWVNAQMRPLGLSPLPQRPVGFANALVQNIATGCTIVLNRSAHRLLRQAPPPPDGLLHDWWALLLVSGAGGRVIYDPRPALLYRQHRGNLVGARRGWWLRAVTEWRHGPRAFWRRLAAVSAALESWPALAPEHAAMLRQLHQGPGWPWLYRQSWGENALLWLWLLARRWVAPAKMRHGPA